MKCLVRQKIGFKFDMKEQTSRLSLSSKLSINLISTLMKRKFHRNFKIFSGFRLTKLNFPAVWEQVRSHNTRSKNE